MSDDTLRAALRKAITDAYYDARNAGDTMETAADNATDAVLAALAASATDEGPSHLAERFDHKEPTDDR